jgi:TatD DNase family protein
MSFSYSHSRLLVIAVSALHRQSYSYILLTSKFSLQVIPRRMSSPRLIDVDCNLLHVDMKSLIIQPNEETSVYQLLSEDAVMESNIVAMISPASTIQEANDSIDMIKKYEGSLEIKTTVGVHPYHVTDSGLDSPENYHDEILQLITSPHVAAIGECGLDATDGFPPMDIQIPWFRAQVQMAQQVRLPLFVHERLAFTETMEILQNIDVPIIIHCFTGTRQECAAYVSKGYYLSISGFIARQGGDEVRQCLIDGIIPLDKLMIETDAPYMGFEGSRTKWLEKQSSHVASRNAKQRKKLQNSLYPNVPSSLPMVLDHVVECLNIGRQLRGERNLSREEVAESTTQNAIQFFGFQQRHSNIRINSTT